MPRAYPHIHPERGFGHDDIYGGDTALEEAQRMRGHPTSPGARDAYSVPAGDPTFADGTPGLPRLQPTPMTHGPGIPGTVPGPKEMDVEYAGKRAEEYGL